MTPGSWTKSTACDTNACMEVQHTELTVKVRNSLQPEYAVTFTVTEWKAFIAGVKTGDFDL